MHGKNIPGWQISEFTPTMGAHHELRRPVLVEIRGLVNIDYVMQSTKNP